MSGFCFCFFKSTGNWEEKIELGIEELEYRGENEDVALFQLDFIHKFKHLTHGYLLVSDCGKGEGGWAVFVCMRVTKHTYPHAQKWSLEAMSSVLLHHSLLPLGPGLSPNLELTDLARLADQ